MKLQDIRDDFMKLFGDDPMGFLFIHSAKERIDLNDFMKYYGFREMADVQRLYGINAVKWIREKEHYFIGTAEKDDHLLLLKFKQYYND
jgi:hypothetical protein